MPIRLILAACLTVLVLPASAAQGENPVLDASVTDDTGFSISLRDPSGARVTHLDPGTYVFQVHDPAVIHNFHLIGPGVNTKTSVEGKEDVTWALTLRDGVYRYQCDPHATVMKGSFTVGTVPTTALRATVGPGRTISLTLAAGGRATSVSTSRVTIAVTDRSRSDNFHLTGHGVNKSTGVGFRGKRTWTLDLANGRYTYRSDAHKRLRGTFVVSAPA